MLGGAAWCATTHACAPSMSGRACHLTGRIDARIHAITSSAIPQRHFTSVSANNPPCHRAQMSEGANFSVVPFVSKRALGVVAGTVGAMGSFGAVILQFAFFFRSKLTYYEGITWMGVLVACVGATTVPLIHFPMWGGMLRGPVEGAEEAGYYISEYTVEEVAAGMATASMRFAVESKSQRGRRTPVGGSQGGVSGGAPGTGSDEKRANKV